MKTEKAEEAEGGLITPQELETLLKQNYSQEKLEKVSKELDSKQRLLKSTRGFLLVPPPPIPLTIQSMARIFPGRISYSNCGDNVNRLKEAVSERWVIVSCSVVENTENLSFEEQVRKIIKAGLCVPSATELLYAGLAYYSTRKEKLFKEKSSRTISSFWSGYRICIRNYDGEFHICNEDCHKRSPYIGMAGKLNT
jgi:hypothetical protein